MDHVIALNAIVEKQFNDNKKLSFNEYLLYSRSLVQPYIKVMQEQQISAPVANLYKSKLFSAMLRAFHGDFREELRELLEKFVRNGQGEDSVSTLHSMGFIPFCHDDLLEILKHVVRELVEQVDELSDGSEPILSVCQQAASHSFQHLRCLSESEHVCKLVEEEFIRVKMNNFVDMCSLYPDSHEAIKEICNFDLMTRENLDLIVGGFRRKLLNPAKSTEEIIGLSVHSVPCFMMIDPTGLFLDRVCLLAKEYLHDYRQSEVASAIYKLFQIINAEQMKTPVMFDNQCEPFMDYWFDKGEKWHPDALLAGDQWVRMSSKSGDTLSVLVNFISSPDDLYNHVHECVQRDIISGHLPLPKTLQKIDNAARILFGKSVKASKFLVMFHDAQETKQLFGKDPIVSPLIISKNYWISSNQTNRNSGLANFPQDILNHLSNTYAQLKPRRKLSWLPEFSNVDLDVIIDDTLYSINSVPLAAYNVAMELQSARRLLRQLDLEGCKFWAEKCMLVIEGDYAMKLCRPSSFKPIDLHCLIMHLMNDGKENDNEPKNNQQAIPAHATAMVMAMLTNLGSMPAARIHSMLSTLSGIKVPVEAISGHLDSLVASGQLSFDPINHNYSRK